MIIRIESIKKTVKCDKCKETKTKNLRFIYVITKKIIHLQGVMIHGNMRILRVSP